MNRRKHVRHLTHVTTALLCALFLGSCRQVYIVSANYTWPQGVQEQKIVVAIENRKGKPLPRRRVYLDEVTCSDLTKPCTCEGILNDTSVIRTNNAQRDAWGRSYQRTNGSGQATFAIALPKDLGNEYAKGRHWLRFAFARRKGNYQKEPKVATLLPVDLCR